MSNSSISKKLAAIITIVLSVILSLFVLYTPSPSVAPQHFSSERALGYIKEISGESHSVFNAKAHENVRLYIKDTLTRLIGSANVREYNYPISSFATETGEVRNLLGVIPGKSETAIMLVGHYDSVDESYGAADDGYALGTMLEIADLYKDQNLENTIYFLFTDSEEMGLDGAAAVVEEQDLMSKVGFVINIEARGVSGPAIMFETSPNNKKVIDFYRKANLPVSYSLATAIYQVMPNDTDFTLFREIGLNGVNFAVVDGIDHYHTPLDNYNELDSSSLQHYGEQIVPLVDDFVRYKEYNDVRYFDADEGSVFFTLLPNIFVSYTGTTANVLHFVVLAILIAVTVFMLRNLYTTREISRKAARLSLLRHCSTAIARHTNRLCYAGRIVPVFCPGTSGNIVSYSLSTAKQDLEAPCLWLNDADLPSADRADNKDLISHAHCRLRAGSGCYPSNPSDGVDTGYPTAYANGRCF